MSTTQYTCWGSPVYGSNVYLSCRMCLADFNVWNQLDRRRLTILDSMIPGFIRRQPADVNDCVWVDGVELREFLSCQKILTPDRARNDELPLQYRRFRCSHQKQGIHPRLARRPGEASSSRWRLTMLTCLYCVKN